MAEPPHPRTVLVTGAGRGIGRSIALVFAEEGDRIVVNDRTDEACAETVSLIRAAGAEAVGIGADVSQRTDVDALFQRAEAEFGPVGIVVNNAASYPEVRATVQTAESFEQVFAVNVTPYSTRHRRPCPGCAASEEV